MTALVTVGIPARNRTDMLREAIASVLAQTWQDFEIFVSDNASVADVRGVVESFKDPRIRFRRHEESIPMAENWQCAFLTPRTKYVATLQDDDYWGPDHLRNALECLEANPRATLYSCAIQHLDANGPIELQLVPGYEHLREPRAFEPAETYPIWMKRHSMQLSCTVFARGALERVDWGPKNNLFPLDLLIVAMSALQGVWIYDPRCTAYYRHHTQNLSSTTSRIQIRYAAQGNYAMRAVTEFAMKVGAFDDERFLEHMAQWPLSQRAGVVVAFSALNAAPALKRFAGRVLERFPDILSSRETSKHCRIAANVGTWYLGVADLLNHARAGWWPIGHRPAASAI